MKPALGAEFALQVSHVLVWVPAAENVPAAQEAMTALDVEVQAVVTRWPAVATVQAVQVGFAFAPV